MEIGMLFFLVPGILGALIAGTMSAKGWAKYPTGTFLDEVIPSALLGFVVGWFWPLTLLFLIVVGIGKMINTLADRAVKLKR